MHKCIISLFMVLGYFSSVAQPVWINGSSHYYQLGNYGQRGVAAPSNIPGARMEAVTWTGKDGNFYMFGGTGNSETQLSAGTMNDLWKFDPITSQWTWLTGSKEASAHGVYGTMGVPGPLNVPGAHSSGGGWVDPNGIYLWMFGGVVPPGSLSNDLWRYNITTNEWAWMGGSSSVDQAGTYGTMGVAATTNIPGGRCSFTSWLDASGKFWLYGGDGVNGADIFGYLDDLWQFNPATGEWMWVNGSDITTENAAVYGTKGIPAPGNTPGARVLSAAAADQAGNLYLFGGYGYPEAVNLGVVNDLWEFNITTGNWTWLSGSAQNDQPGIYGTQGQASSSNMPGSRNAANAWFDNGRFFLFGGNGQGASYNSGGELLNDMWYFDITSQQWAWAGGSQITNNNGTYGSQGVVSAGNWPGAREEAMVWKGTNSIYLFGGYGEDASGGTGGDYLGDVWKLNATLSLPVFFGDISARKVNTNVVLQWTTLQESNALSFVVERGNIDGSFSIIGTKNATGNSNILVSYDFTDMTPNAGRNIYRVRQVDTDGKFTYSKVVTVNIDVEAHNITIFPNPTKDKITIRLPVAGQQWGMHLYDERGRLVLSGITSDNSPVLLEKLLPGIYYIKLNYNNINYVQAIIKD